MNEKSPYVLIIIILSSLIFTTCKKGPDDPQISLRTRKARVVGEWRMKSGTASITLEETGEPPFNQAHQFDGSNSTINQTESGNVAYIYKSTYILSVKFNSDGTFEMNEAYIGKPLTATGHWNFGGRVGDVKNKEEIIMVIDKVSNGDTDGHIFNKWGSEFVYKIVGLHNKEMKIESGSKPYMNANGDAITIETHYTLTQ
ncbi:MAG: hypothetical protein K0S32_834 [Bacteroidetes bacterium]|jgi:hypothetical protein|nr:hypothetical protein [Bacteroidota bacterium]